MIYDGYIVVTSSSCDWLEKEVNEKMQKGWQPIGGLSIYKSGFSTGSTIEQRPVYNQAMVKLKELEK